MYWIAHLVGGPRRVNHTAVSVGDFIYTFGGYCSASANQDYQSMVPIDVHMLNTQTLRWYLVHPKKDKNGQSLQYPTVPFQRYGHAAVAYKHLVYMWGGRNDEMCCNILFCFDTLTHSWSKPDVIGRIPGLRDGHSACILNNQMYIFGGFEEERNQFSCDVHCLNLETMSWSAINTTGTPPSYRDFHTASIINNRMYIFGGRGDRHSPFHTQEELYCAQIVYLDLKTFEWHTPPATGTIPIGRRSHSAVVFNQKLYIWGGFNSILNEHFNDLYCYDPAISHWNLIQPKGHLPKQRRRHVCLVVGKRMYLFGGTSPVDVYNPVSPTSLHQLLWDFNDTHVLDFEPSLMILSLMTVLESNINTSILPQTLKNEIRAITSPNYIIRPINNTG